MPGSHGTLCINSFYPETELNITKIQEYEKTDFNANEINLQGLQVPKMWLYNR